MDTPNSLNSKKSKNLLYKINKNWEELDENQKSTLNKIYQFHLDQKEILCLKV